jgi:hypothetical protein
MEVYYEKAFSVSDYLFLFDGNDYSTEFRRKNSQPYGQAATAAGHAKNDFKDGAAKSAAE